MSFLRLLLRLSILGIFGAIWLLAGAYLYLSPNLPDVETLRDVRLQTPMRVYTRDGELIGQFGEQKRSPLLFDAIPDQFIKSLLAAEDDNFFNHRGIDVMGLARAVSELVLTGEKGSGLAPETAPADPAEDVRLRSPSVARNREALLGVLRSTLPPDPRVLEVGSGSGEHAVFVAGALPNCFWIPSDADQGARVSITAWVDHSGLANVAAPAATTASASAAGPPPSIAPTDSRST